MRSTAGGEGARDEARGTSGDAGIASPRERERVGVSGVSVEIARARRQRAEHRREIDEPAGEHVHDAAFALDAAVDGEQPRAEQFAALAATISINIFSLPFSL